MKHSEKLLSCIAGGLTLCTAASAVTAESPANPYQDILVRNVFSLKAPPPPVDPNEPPKPQALKITLNGIITLGTKRALMKTPPPAGAPKPGDPPKTEQSYILAEGERQGDIEVLEINEKLGSVKVNNAGTIATLTFEKDGPKGSPAGAAPPPPGGVPPPTGMPQPAMAPPGGGSPFPMPTRSLRTQMPGNPGMPGTASGAGGAAAPSLGFGADARPASHSSTIARSPGIMLTSTVL
jgi:hypothetical protein